MYKKYFKRVLDIIISIVLLLIFSPIIILTALSLSIINRNFNVFFLHERPGLNGRIFKVIKFKTMTDEKDRDGFLLPDEQRLTKVGKIIRKLSLDELPQILNVLKGDMSLVGPRPLMVKYLKLYTPEQNRRHEVHPGITGWAQVNGRNDISWIKKFEFDIWYVDNLTFRLDLLIILMTIKKVIFKEGISKNGHATTEAFNGKN